jgi:hypothetical protein
VQALSPTPLLTILVNSGVIISQVEKLALFANNGRDYVKKLSSNKSVFSVASQYQTTQQAVATFTGVVQAMRQASEWENTLPTRGTPAEKSGDTDYYRAVSNGCQLLPSVTRDKPNAWLRLTHGQSNQQTHRAPGSNLRIDLQRRWHSAKICHMRLQDTSRHIQ